MKFDTIFATLSGYLAVFGVLDRPQTPHERAYVIEHVRIPGGSSGVILDGELTLPNGIDAVPGVVLITGSGPQNKDEELAGHKPFLVLADHLTKSGYGVLRFDDRGVGKSTGNFKTASASDLAADAAAALVYLKAHPRITPDKAGYLGHSEGGYLGPMAHRKVRSGFQIYLAGPALPLLPDVMRAQVTDIVLAEGGSQKDVATEVATVESIAKILKSTTDIDDVRNKISHTLNKSGATKKQIDENLSVWATPWALEYAHYQPGKALSDLDVPVLALYGEKDLQVAAESNAAEMRVRLRHPHSETDILSGLNHLFQPAPTGRLSEYVLIKTTLDPQALNRITEWLAHITAPSAQ